MTATVRQLLQVKGQRVFDIHPQATVYQALERMAQHDVGALLVLEEGRLVGIFSERDYARKIILMGRASRETPVHEVMTTDLVTVSPEATVGECMALMTEHRIRHLPVMEGGQLAGVISIGDVVKAIMTEQEFLIAQLQQYINS
ncbi:MAG: histidine kinase [Meiothermus sp.]